MITSLTFKNFKALRDTTLPLGRFTLIVGPNGSGKTTALRAFDVFRSPASSNYSYSKLLTCGVEEDQESPVKVTVGWEHSTNDYRYFRQWTRDLVNSQDGWEKDSDSRLVQQVQGVQVYSLDANLSRQTVQLHPRVQLGPQGHGLAAVLDQLRDREPERFEAMNSEIGRMLPEFDRILFDTPDAGQRCFLLRVRGMKRAIPAVDLSDGTVFALAMLTLAYLPVPPPLVGIEEPEHGIHPRLLREVQQSLYRLSYPENFGETRAPVQVVATTHSPYFLDLFRDHPEEVVIAQKTGIEAKFEKLVDRQDIADVLANAPLGEVWYSGVLGGVPVEP